MNIEFLKPSHMDIVVEKSLSEYRGAYGSGMPVQVEQFLESNYGVTIMPLPGIRELSIDCGLSADGTSVWVDEEAYKIAEGPEYNRMRFSLAHEIGHLELHKQLLPRVLPLNYQEVMSFISNFDPVVHAKLEVQANMFAARLLMPTREVVGRLAAQIVQNIDVLKDNSVSLAAYSQFIAPNLANEFNVSPQAMANRLAKLDYDLFTSGAGAGILIAECDLQTLRALSDTEQQKMTWILGLTGSKVDS